MISAARSDDSKSYIEHLAHERADVNPRLRSILACLHFFQDLSRNSGVARDMCHNKIVELREFVNC